MSWLETIIVGVVLLGAGLYLLLGVAIIVTSLVERQSVKYLAPADLDDPEWRKVGLIGSDHGPPGFPEADSSPSATAGSTAYPEPQFRAASRLGFAAPQLFKHAKGGIYKTYNVLSVSPSQEILAVFRWGKTASIRNEATVLYSGLGDSRYLITSDRPSGARTPGFYDDMVCPDATFDELVIRHEERLRDACREGMRFSREDPLADFEVILAERARFLVANGNAYWVDPGKTEFAQRSRVRFELRPDVFDEARGSDIHASARCW